MPAHDFPTLGFDVVGCDRGAGDDVVAFFTTRRRTLRDRCDDGGSLLSEGQALTWVGEAGDAFRSDLRDLAGALGEVVDVADSLVRSARDYGVVVDDAFASADRLERAAVSVAGDLAQATSATEAAGAVATSLATQADQAERTAAPDAGALRLQHAAAAAERDRAAAAAADAREELASLKRQAHLLTDGVDEAILALVREFAAVKVNEGEEGSWGFVATAHDVLADPALDGFGNYEDRAGDELFGPGGPTISDVQQQGLGDCWLIAALGAVAKSDPARIRELIEDNGDGTYTVHFADEDVTVDADVSSETSDSALWVALVEKAYAQREGDGYEDINGGYATDAFEDVFGASVSTHDPDSTRWWGNKSPGDSLDDIRAALKDHRPVTVAIRGTMGIDGGHALTVTKVKGDSITIRNPWGDNSSIKEEVEAAGGKIDPGGYITFSEDEFADAVAEVQLVSSW